MKLCYAVFLIITSIIFGLKPCAAHPYETLRGLKNDFQGQTRSEAAIMQGRKGDLHSLFLHEQAYNRAIVGTDGDGVKYKRTATPRRSYRNSYTKRPVTKKGYQRAPIDSARVKTQDQSIIKKNIDEAASKQETFKQETKIKPRTYGETSK